MFRSGLGSGIWKGLGGSGGVMGLGGGLGSGRGLGFRDLKGV